MKKDKLIENKINKLLEATAPENAEDSKKLRDLFNKHYFDTYSDEPNLTDEEKALLNKYNLKYDGMDQDIYPAEYERAGNFYKDSQIGLKRQYDKIRFDRSADIKQDWTQLGRKRLQRRNAGSANDHHGYGRNSDEKTRLMNTLSNLKKGLEVAKINNWEDEIKKTERMLKIYQTKLNNENNRLKDIRRNSGTTYLNQERIDDERRMTSNVRRFKGAKRELDRLADRKNAADAGLKDYIADHERKIKEIEDERIETQGEIDKLLRRDKLKESVSKDAQEVINPTYAKAMRDLEETDKKKADYLKVPEHNQGPKENKVKATKEMKKLHLDENLFLESDNKVNEGWAEARPNEAKLYDYIDNYGLDWQAVAEAALSYLSDDDIGDLATQYGWVTSSEDYLDESAETRLSSDGRQRPTSYAKKVVKKPLSLQVYDTLTDLGYNVFAGTEGAAFRTSKKYEKNLQPAKDYLDSKNVEYKVKPFQGRYHLLINLPEDDDKVFNYFDNIDQDEKRAVNESLTKNKTNKESK